jgi:hypothetical protein
VDFVSQTRTAAGVLTVHLDVLEVHAPEELGAAFIEMKRRRGLTPFPDQPDVLGTAGRSGKARAAAPVARRYPEWKTIQHSVSQ